MPRIIRCALFTTEEARAIAQAYRLIDIPYPLKSDPLVQRSTEALARAVNDDDDRRRVLGSLRSPFDPITYRRLHLAEIALTALLDQVVKESDAAHWLSLASDPNAVQAIQMAEVLAAERTGQQRLVRDALAIVAEALRSVTPTDEPHELRAEKYQGL